MNAVAFDLDDTLYPERAYVSSGFRAVAQWLGERTGAESAIVAQELESLFDQGPRGTAFDRWLEARRLPGEWLAEMLRVYRGHSPEIAPHPEVPPLLERLRQRVRLGLLTEGRLAVQARKLEALGLSEAFEAIVILDQFEVDSWKPSLVPFQRLLERLNVEGQRAAYVGDNPVKDFLGARLCGMRTVRVRRPGGLYSDLAPAGAEEGPDLEVPDLRDLDRRLGLSDEP